MEQTEEPLAQLRAWLDECPFRRWRLEQGASIMETASLLGVSVTTIQNWEHGLKTPSDQHRAVVESVCGQDVTASWTEWFDRRPVPDAA